MRIHIRTKIQNQVKKKGSVLLPFLLLTSYTMTGVYTEAGISATSI